MRTLDLAGALLLAICCSQASLGSTSPEPILQTIRAHSFIDLSFARTMIGAYLLNPAAEEQLVSFDFVIPEEALISSVTVRIDGVFHETQIKERTKQQSDEVEQYDGPENSQRFTVSANVPPHLAAQFYITYEEFLIRKNNVVRHDLFLTPRKVIDNIIVTVDIEDGLGALPETTFKVLTNGQEKEIEHDELKINHNHARHTQMIWELNSDDQVKISKDGLNAAVITHMKKHYQSSQELVVGRGDFSLLRQRADGFPPLPRRVTFIIDLGVSMRGDKMNQLRAAMIKAFVDFSERDYFSIILFSSKAWAWEPVEGPVYLDGLAPEAGRKFLISATKANVDQAINYINSWAVQQHDHGNVHEGLIKGLEIADLPLNDNPAHYSAIVFVTADIGSVNPEDVIKDVVAKNTNRIPLFAVGLGEKSKYFLKKLSYLNYGEAKVIANIEDIAEDFYDFINSFSYVAITNIRFDPWRHDFSQLDPGVLNVGSEFHFLAPPPSPPVDGYGITAEGNVTWKVISKTSINDVQLPFLDILPRSQSTEGLIERMWAFETLKGLLKKYDCTRDESILSDIKEYALKYSYVTPLTVLTLDDADQEKGMISLHGNPRFLPIFLSESGVSVSMKPIVKSLNIFSDIKYAFARTTVICVMQNPAEELHAVTFDVTIPVGALVTDFGITMGDKVYDAVVQAISDAEPSNATDLSTTSAGSPDFNHGLRNAKPFTVSTNVEGQGTVTFRLVYEELLPRTNRHYRSEIHINPGQIVDDLSAITEVEDDVKMLGVKRIRVKHVSEDSQDQEVDIDKEKTSVEFSSSKKVKLEWRPKPEEQASLNKNGVNGKFIVEYETDNKNSHNILIDPAGYFAHIFRSDESAAFAKHVTLVVDVSSLMSDVKITHLKESLVKILSDLKETDYFSIIVFAGRALAWDPSNTLDLTTLAAISDERRLTKEIVVAATKESVATALSFIETLRTFQQGSNIYSALMFGLEASVLGLKLYNSPSTPVVPVIVFLTDGLPNVGLNDPEEIIKEIHDENTNQIPIFSVGFGEDSGMYFLRKLSILNFGFALKLYIANDAPEKLFDFYKSIASQTFTDIKLEYQEVTDVTDSEFKDLHAGSEILSLGKANIYGSVPVHVKAAGPAGPVDITASNPKIIKDQITVGGRTWGYVEKMWAFRKVKALLERYAVTQDGQLKKEIQDLAMKYNYLTPVTTMVVSKEGEVIGLNEKFEERHHAPFITAADEAPANHNSPFMRSLHINSDVKFSYARTSVCSNLMNPLKETQAISFDVIIPEQAYITGVLMTSRGKTHQAYAVEKAESTPSTIEVKNPILPRNTKAFTVFAEVHPRTEVIFNVTYEELLRRTNNIYRNEIHLNPKEIVDDLEVTVKIEDDVEFLNINGIEIQDTGSGLFENPAAEQTILKFSSAKKVKLIWKPSIEDQKMIKADGISGKFVVEFDTDSGSSAQHMLVDRDGFFLHFFKPVDMPILNKHIVFVLDVSGSMDGLKISQLQGAMIKILSDLQETDYFTIVLFSNDVSVLYPTGFAAEGREEVQAMPASQANKDLAKQHINGISSLGGTNLLGGLRAGMKLAENTPETGLTSLIVVLTDGLPDNGPAATLAAFPTENTHQIPIFTLGFGENADMTFLEMLGKTNFGFEKKIFANADAADQLLDFYKSISSPVLSDIKMNFEQAENDSITNSEYKTLFSGSQLVTLGRMSADGQISGKLSAVGPAGAVEYEIPPPVLVDDFILLPNGEDPLSPDTVYGYVEKMWAYQSIKNLLSKNLVSPNEDIVKIARELAVKYSFLTPLSSLALARRNEVLILNEDTSRPHSEAAENLIGLSSSSFTLVPLDIIDDSLKISIVKDAAKEEKKAEEEPNQLVSYKEIEWLIGQESADGQQLTPPASLGTTALIALREPNIDDTKCDNGLICRHFIYCPLKTFAKDVNQYVPFKCQLAPDYLGVCCPV